MDLTFNDNKDQQKDQVRLQFLSCAIYQFT